jgi:hypothetical protein
VSGGSEGERRGAEHVGLARGAAAELSARVAAHIGEWARRRGFDPATPISALVVLTADDRRARTLRQVVEAVGADPSARRVAGWFEERCAVDPNARALTMDLHRDFVEWLRPQGLPHDSMRRFALRLRALGAAVWRDPWSRRHGFAGLALKPAAGRAEDDPPASGV